MSINWDKRLKVKQHTRAEILHWIKHYAEVKKTHDDFINLRKKLLWDNSDVRKLPQYMQSGLESYFDACEKILVTDNLVFMYKWTDGKFYTVKQIESFDDFTHFKLAQMDSERGFFWDSEHPHSTNRKG